MLGVVTHIFNSGSQEAEAVGLWFPGQPELHSKPAWKKRKGWICHLYEQKALGFITFRMGSWFAGEESHFWQQTKNVPVQRKGSSFLHAKIIRQPQMRGRSITTYSFSFSSSISFFLGGGWGGRVSVVLAGLELRDLALKCWHYRRVPHVLCY